MPTVPLSPGQQVEQRPIAERRAVTGASPDHFGAITGRQVERVGDALGITGDMLASVAIVDRRRRMAEQQELKAQQDADTVRRSELGWEDQDFIREQHAARDAEREARNAEDMRRYEARERGEREAACVENEIAQMPRNAEAFRAGKLHVIGTFLAAVGGRGMEPCGGYYFDDATIGEVHELIFEIAVRVANADVRYSEAKRLMAEAELRAQFLAESESE